MAVKGVHVVHNMTLAPWLSWTSQAFWWSSAIYVHDARIEVRCQPNIQLHVTCDGWGLQCYVK